MNSYSLKDKRRVKAKLKLDSLPDDEFMAPSERAKPAARTPRKMLRPIPHGLSDSRFQKATRPAQLARVPERGGGDRPVARSGPAAWDRAL
jgi:hypothetical protein